MLSEDEDRCPFCQTVNLPGSCSECEHFVGQYETERELIGFTGEDEWSSITALVEELLDLGVPDALILAALPAQLESISSTADAVMDASIVDVLVIWADCDYGETTEFLGATSSQRTCLYCPDPKALELTLQSLGQLQSKLEKLRP